MSARIGTIERLPKFWLCVPLVAQWFWLAARYRSLTLPSVLNPAIETGGLAGESKLACLDFIGTEHADHVAPTSAVSPGADPEAVRLQAGLAYPLVAKPDIGWCGYGVRRIDTAAQLADYAAAFPPGACYLLQAFAPGPCEAGLFYRRGRHDAAGRIIAITLRHQPQVLGDGVSTLAALLQRDPRLAGRRFEADLARVPALNEIVVLSTVASLRVGGRYEDASAHVTVAMEAALDGIARSMPSFHFGRFDVRFESMDALQAGRFTIIEVNGAGSEAIQYWDPSLTLMQAYRGVFAKQQGMFALSDEFRRAGRRPVGVLALAKAWLRQQKMQGLYPASN